MQSQYSGVQCQMAYICVCKNKFSNKTSFVSKQFIKNNKRLHWSCLKTELQHHCSIQRNLNLHIDIILHSSCSPWTNFAHGLASCSPANTTHSGTLQLQNLFLRELRYSPASLRSAAAGQESHRNPAHLSQRQFTEPVWTHQGTDDSNTAWCLGEKKIRK